MITGDNLLTAVYVAKAANMTKSESVRLLELDEDRSLVSSVISNQRFCFLFFRCFCVVGVVCSFLLLKIQFVLCVLKGVVAV